MEKGKWRKLRKNLSRAVATILVTSLLLPSSSALLPKVEAAASPRTDGAYYKYGEALQKGILFYKANRLGDLPDDYILPYRTDAAMTDGQDVGLDLTGGWADAGDGIKFTHTISYAAAQLGWDVYEYRQAFEKAGQLDDILDEIKWGTDFLIKAHPKPDVLYYMCGYNDSDHGCWVAHEFLDYMTKRTSFVLNSSTPGSDVAGMTAAALAIASIIFEPTDPDYAKECLKHAKEVFAFGDKYRGKNPLDVLYPSGGYLDDLAWGAIWLYIKTEDSTYLEKAKSCLPTTSLGGGHTHCWDDVSYGAALKIAQVSHDEGYVKAVEKNLDYWMPGGGITYSPGGLAWLSPWGSLRYATTAAFLAFVWSDDKTVGTASKKETYRKFAESQVNYALGDNPRKGSYVVGFGENAPEHPHHRTAHGSWVSTLETPAFHRHILYGALVGGPNADDSWKDDITDYRLNEVAIDYNAGFVGCVAKMYDMYGGEPLENWPKPEDFRAKEDDLTEYFCRAWIIYEGFGSMNIMFQLNNRSAWPPTVKDKLSVRYYMDLSELFEAGKGLDDVKITLGDNQGAKLIGLKQYKDNIYYFTVDFTGTMIMPTEWEMCEKDATVTIQYKDMNIGSNENDWSYKDLRSDPDYNAESFKGMTPYIPVYDDGKLLWGLEPLPGVEVSPSSPADDPTPTLPVSTPTPAVKSPDINGDGVINISDVLLIATAFNSAKGDARYIEKCDLNNDNAVNIADVFLVAAKFNTIVK
jgi:hypothetical protein